MKRILPFCFHVYIHSCIILSIKSYRASADQECDNHVRDNEACLWIAKDKQRRTEYCKQKSYHLACPVVCGSCCKDDDNFSFQLRTGTVVKCNWLTEHKRRKVNKERRSQYCQSTKKKERLIKWACAKSCGHCPQKIPYEDNPTFTPSAAPSPPMNIQQAIIVEDDVYVAPSLGPSESFVGESIPSLEGSEDVKAFAQTTAATTESTLHTQEMITSPTKTPSINKAPEGILLSSNSIPPSVAPTLQDEEEDSFLPTTTLRPPRGTPKPRTKAPTLYTQSGAAMAIVYDEGGGKAGGKKVQSAYPSISPTNIPTVESSIFPPSQQQSVSPSVTSSMSPSTSPSNSTSFSPSMLASVSDGYELVEPAPEISSSKERGTWKKALSVSGIAVGSTVVFIMLLLVCLITASRSKKRSFPGI